MKNKVLYVLTFVLTRENIIAYSGLMAAFQPLIDEPDTIYKLIDLKVMRPT